MSDRPPLSPPAEQKLFVRTPNLETMRPAPIRIEWRRVTEDPLAAVRADLVSSIDFSLLNEIFENFLEVTGLLIALIDLEGNVLASSKWQRLCVEFHRSHPRTLSRCITSDTVLSQTIQAGTDYATYRCANGLIDCAAPVVIEGVHVANLFTGQFLLSSPDKDYFRRQQESCGFDREAYFNALAEVPIVSEQKIPAVFKLLKGLAQQIARQSLAEKRALAALAGVEKQVTERTREARDAQQAQERASRALRLLTECNNALLHADQEQRLLQDICRLITDKGGYRMAWVGFAEQDPGKSVRPVAQSGAEAGYFSRLPVSWDDTPIGRGPAGTAIRTGATQIVRDCRSDPILAPWREAVVRQGCQSIITLPLCGSQGVLGALTVYAGEADAFAAEEVELLEKLGQNLAFGIGALRARIRLAKANQELHGFTYAASHDLKGPLGRIAAFSRLLEQQYRDRLDGDGLHFLDFIGQNATRLTTLVDGLLAHPQSLVQALRNLLANALKYSCRSRPPRVEIGGQAEGGGYRLWIRDNGVGFDMKYHDRIFEMFRRLHTYSEYPGNGVGLALVRKAMESMGGRVWADSQPGHGATFFLEFQVAA